MTSRANIYTQFILKHRTEQRGVTLLLSILILASLLAISFSLATVLLVEVRSSGDLLRTEPAYYAAQGITEDVIFKIKRRTNIAVNATTTNEVLVSAPIERATASPVQILRIDESTTFDTTNAHLYFFDATYPQLAASGYGKVQITYEDTGNLSNLQVYLCERDETEDPCTSVGPFLYTANLVRGDTWTRSINSNKQQELILVNTSSNPMYATVTTYAADGTTPKGLPFSGETSVEVKATRSGVTRTLETRIPNN